MKLEIIGVEPACKRCRQTLKKVAKAAKRLRAKGIEVEVEKIDVRAKETMERFGGEYAAAETEQGYSTRWAAKTCSPS